MTNEATLLLRKLLKNEEFKKKFLERFYYIMSNVFIPERINTIVENYINLLKDEIVLHSNRWGKPDAELWKEDCLWLSNFGYLRKEFIENIFKNFFESE